MEEAIEAEPLHLVSSKFGGIHPVQGGKNTHAHVYPWVKSVTGTGRVAKWVSTDIINRYLTTHYYMGTYTNLIVSIPQVPIPNNKLSKLLKYRYISCLIT